MTSPSPRRVALGGLVLLMAMAPRPGLAQAADAATLLGLAHSLDRTARVLVITARPEDEPAGLVAWLHFQQGAEVGVLSLHRGESGANRFQREVGEALGVLRVQEAVRVRQVAGGRQFYTRAFDFGAPDSEQSMWRRWPRELLLADLVTVIRSLRPQLLIVGCEAESTPPDLQARAAQQLAEEAFTAAGDSAAVPISSSHFLPPWQPTHLYQVSCDPGQAPIRIPLGGRFLPTGESFAQIGARAMAWQRTQGLGTIVEPGAGEIGLRLSRSLVLERGESEDLFAGVPASLHQVAEAETTATERRKGLEALAQQIGAIQVEFDPANPAAALDPLVAGLRAVRAELLATPSARGTRSPWLEEEADRLAMLTILEDRLSRLTLAAAGIEARLEAPRSWVARDDSVVVTLTLFNSGPHPVGVRDGTISLGLPRQLPRIADSLTLAPGGRAHWTAVLQPLDPTVSWWLASRRDDDVYRYPTTMASPPGLLTGEGTERLGRAEVRLVVQGEEVRLVTDPASTITADPDLGLVREPLVIMPPITVLLERMLDYSLADRAFRRRLPVEIRSWSSRAREVTVRVEPPSGVTVMEPIRQLTMEPGDRIELLFDLMGILPRERHALRVYVESEGETFVFGAIPIRYDHISPVQVYRGAGLWLDAVPSRAPANAEVGYLPGDQDFNQVAFRQLGLRVTDLNPAALDSAALAGLRRIAIGPGAFRSADLRRLSQDLLDWVVRGGRLVVQSGGPELMAASLLPWPFELAQPSRQVSGEGVLFGPAPGAERWWREPHQIDALDLDDWRWVVARHQPESLDPRYRPIILAHEAPGDAGTPVAWATSIGQGMLVYTTLVLPPQVLAGEGGALRILLNLLFAPGF